MYIHYIQLHTYTHTYRLQRFVDNVVERFIKAAPEMMQREFEREGVKLHATLVNCTFLGQEKGGELEVHRGRRRQLPTETVDATRLVEVGNVATFT